MATAARIPVYGASSLDMIARHGLDRLSPQAHVFAVSDARRRELYWGHYVAEGPDDVRLIGRLEVGSAQMLANQMVGEQALIVAAGQIPAHSVQVLQSVELGPIVDEDPAVLSRLVSARLSHGDLERLGTQPEYLRRPDIHGQAPQRL